MGVVTKIILCSIIASQRTYNKLEGFNAETAKKERFYRNLFLVAALYDFILGFFFFVFWHFIFDHILKIPYPNYPAFYQAAAAFIFNMGIGFYFVYRNMYRNIDIVKVGIVFKLFYTGLAFYLCLCGEHALDFFSLRLFGSHLHSVLHFLLARC